MKFKIGDRVRCFYNDKGNSEYVGCEGVITKIGCGRDPVKYPYATSFASTSCFGEHELEFTGSKIKNMNLKQKMALVFKGEPEKSFIKAGIMNTDETLTSDGQAVFLAYLLKKNGDDFKKEVVDPILAEEDK